MPRDSRRVIGGDREPLPPLYLITDASRLGEVVLLDRVERALRGGLSWVLVREPTWEDHRLEALLGALRAVVEREETRRGSGSRVILSLSRRAPLARALGIEGLHVGGGDPGLVREARELLGRSTLIGYSAHSREELEAAAREGADYASLSPVFGALSKKHPLEALGLEGLALAVRGAPLPVYALGAVTPEAAASLRRAGAAGAAMIGGLLDAPEPGEAARRFLDGWEAAAPSP